MDPDWRRAPLSLSFAATDDLSGVAYTEYDLDGSGYVRGLGLTVADDGIHSLVYRSVDVAGHVEEPRRAIVRIDSTAPITTVSGVEEVHDAPVRLLLTAVDHAGVGALAATEHRVDDGPFKTGPSFLVWSAWLTPLTVSGNGHHVVYFRSRDQAGNVELWQRTSFEIDTVAPATRAGAAVAVNRGRRASFSFRVKEAGGTATASIRIYKGSALRKTIALGRVRANKTQIRSWRCTLPKGTYRWRVFATDAAGNDSVQMTWAKLTVR
jgi:hypothetical protein